MTAMNSNDPVQHDRRRPADGEAESSRHPDDAIRRIAIALHGLRYGSVLVIVQDGIVVQIERTEKTRFGK